MVWNYRRRLWLLVLLVVVPISGMAQAASESDADSTLQLKPITVLGTRTAKTPDAVPRSIDVVGRAQIALEQGTNLGAIVDVLPNVSLVGSPRPVGETINIRGLSGKRILLLVDGIELNNTMGHIGGSFVAPGLIESVEVERGPASVLWGSGALGGVVSVNTKEANDLLAEGQDVGARLHGGYQSASDGWITRAAVYGHLGDNVDALVQIGRASHEDLDLGGSETLADSAYRRVSGLAKATWFLAPGNALQFSHRRMQLDAESPFNAAAQANDSSNPLTSRTVETGASRIQWTFVPPPAPLVDLEVALSHIRTESNTDDLFGMDGFRGVTEQFGLDLVNTSHLDAGGWGRHVLTYGIDANYASVDSADKQGSCLFPVFVGCVSGQSVQAHNLIAGAFVQDEMHWNEAWTTTLGLRYDRFQSESDDGAHDQQDSALSLQAGLLWQATDWLQFYASYAEAFRAPSVSEMYMTGSHYLYNMFVPNPNLEPERAANKEIGLRAQWDGLFAPKDRLKLELTAFHNDVENYIQQTVTPGAVTVDFPGPGSFSIPGIGGTTTVANVHDAELEGFEMVVSYATGAWFIAMTYGQTRGYNETLNEPLADVPADTWTVKAGVTALPWNGRVIWRMTHAEAQDRVPAGGETTDSYTVHDLLTTWQPTPKLRLDFGIGNITDRAYRVHNSVIKAAGRNVKLGVTWQF